MKHIGSCETHLVSLRYHSAILEMAPCRSSWVGSLTYDRTSSLWFWYDDISFGLYPTVLFTIASWSLIVVFPGIGLLSRRVNFKTDVRGLHLRLSWLPTGILTKSWNWSDIMSIGVRMSSKISRMVSLCAEALQTKLTYLTILID